MFNQDKVQRFSLRKYSIGLASVLLGIFLFENNTVKKRKKTLSVLYLR
ncbi:YSIRK-type signal peptide-containing protein [Streptococcus sp. 121]